MSRSTLVLGASSDFQNLIGAAIRSARIKLVRSGLFSALDLEEYRQASSMPNLGLAFADDSTQEPMYLCIPEDAPVVVREVPQRKGGVRYAVDQMANQESVIIQPGGLRPDGIIIGGSIGTAYDNPIALKIYRAFQREVRSSFTCVSSRYWLGNEALRLLRSGARLTYYVRAPLEADIRED